MYEELRARVLKANLDLAASGLVILTWGNVSEIDREAGVFAIKPSGVEYAGMTDEDIVVVNLSGEQVFGDKRPSSDTPTHLALYRAFGSIGGVAHTHSTHATAWAQAGCDLPCYGTTHADAFYGPVPATRQLRRADAEENYELNTGLVIVDAVKNHDPLAVPAALVSGHGPFTWGDSAKDAVHNAIILEEVAKSALYTRLINPSAGSLQRSILDKHYKRKHGENAYYGQAH